jgi:hypothetical protein
VLLTLPIPPGKPQREDDKYHRNGTCCLFLAFELLIGPRVIRAHERRTKVDHVRSMKALVEQHDPEQNRFA